MSFNAIFTIVAFLALVGFTDDQFLVVTAGIIVATLGLLAPCSGGCWPRCLARGL